MRIAFFGAALGAALVGCHAREREPAPRPMDAPPVAVPVMTLRATEQTATVRLVAVAEPKRRAAVGTKLLARVLDVRAEEGARVAQGALLVQLDTRDLSARRRQVGASAAAADAQARLAADELARVRQLREAGAIATAQLDSAQTSVTAAAAAADGSHAALAELGVTLGESTIRAPFDALVVQKRTEVGTFSVPGQPLVVLEDDSTLRVLAPIADRQAGAMKLGTSYSVSFATGEQTTGLLDAIVPSGDPRSPGLMARLLVANEQHRVRAGVVAYVTVPSGERGGPALRVPPQAIVRRGGLTGVFTVRGDRLEIVWCAIDGSAHDEMTRVLDGLVDGDVVVTDAGSPELADGRRVTVKP
jgi:RND family efflux transporter MFP subunit